VAVYQSAGGAPWRREGASHISSGALEEALRVGAEQRRGGKSVRVCWRAGRGYGVTEVWHSMGMRARDGRREGKGRSPGTDD